MTRKEAIAIAREGIAETNVDRIYDVIDFQMPVEYTDKDADKVASELKNIIKKWQNRNRKLLK
jgi:hypothetical protein